MQFVDGVGSLVKGGVKLGGKIAKGAKAVKELEKGARLTELAKTFVTGAKDSSELNSAASKAAKVAKLRVVREAGEAKKVEKAASATEKFRSELDVLKQRAREVPRTLTDDEIRACEAVKLQMKGKLPEPGKVSVAEVEKIDKAVRAANAVEESLGVAKTEFVEESSNISGNTFEVIVDPSRLLESTKYPQDHHIIPAFRDKSKPYADFIKRLGIDVDQYTITVSGGKGGMHMNFIHGKGK